METSAVIQLYERSVEKHSLFYNPFIGDGDSSAYRELCNINVYGPAKLIEKEEYIGHVVKRMGLQLQSIVRHYKGKNLSDGTAINAKGRLTNLRIDALQSLYGHILKTNKGNSEVMAKGVMAILYR